MEVDEKNIIREIVSDMSNKSAIIALKSIDYAYSIFKYIDDSECLLKIINYF